ncbi:hypothetical protein WHZ77_23295 [Bradyrhizobium sp. A5]|uniref:hypothetical protein n=1 Tax=Bradyrhizobium sp. A5 TaxID=3133696 RepID=UPI0032489ECE
MYVDFIADQATKVDAFRNVLEPRHVIVPRLLGGGDTEIRENCALLMVDADLRVQQIKLVVKELGLVPEPVRLIDVAMAAMGNGSDARPPRMARTARSHQRCQQKARR